MHKMLMSTIAAAVLIQGCSTVTDHTTEGAGFVAHDSEYVRVAGGDCLRSSGWTSDSLAVECQASSRVETAETPAAPAPAPKKLARLSYNGKALFEFDSAQLSPTGRQELDKLVAKMNSHKGIGEVKVVGHADSTGEQQYNQSLSERRAATVRSYLTSALNDVSVSAVGKGEADPVADNSTAAGRQQNRRVEVNVDATVEQ